ncbi:MAG: ABC transporter permease [Bacteroidota bacterium]|nr:ABC transporter permease [Bacteroidota bacterium]
MDIKDISWIDLSTGFILLLAPLLILWYYKTGLVLKTLLAAGRMTLQLFLVGLYLTYLFELNNVWVNIAWVLVMILVNTFTISDRSELKLRAFAIPVTLGTLIAIAIVDGFFLGLSLRLENIFEARYFIAITGMIMGNTIERNIIALNSFYKSLEREKLRYNFALSCGAKKSEALLPFFKDSLKRSFNPQLARMSIMGIIALPGMMTGQILGGSSPQIAIKYQIMLMLMIFIAGMLTVVITLNMANRFVFDKFGNLKTGKVLSEKAG